MQREFKPTSKMVRSVFAIAAIVASMFVVGLIDSLFGHYGGLGHFAIGRPAVVAHR